uniref:Uncharacterized protein n=1 Tax=Glossina palpalis gambiensis TaxID=67801 RepID=A0A1B0B8S2_9MUSC
MGLFTNYFENKVITIRRLRNRYKHLVRKAKRCTEKPSKMASLPNSQDAGNFSCIPVQTISSFSMQRCISNKTKITSYAPPLSNSSSASNSTTSSSNKRTFSSSSSLALANVETIVSAPNAASTCSRRSIICDSMTSQRFKPVSTKADLLAQQKLSDGLIEVLLRFGANGGGGLNAPHGPTSHYVYDSMIRFFTVTMTALDFSPENCNNQENETKQASLRFFR